MNDSSRRTRIAAAVLMLPGAAIIPATLGLVPFGAAIALAGGFAAIALARCFMLPEVRPSIIYGLLAGLCATAAYDAVRLALAVGGVVGNPFRSIELYGAVMLGRYDLTTTIVGWSYHAWNGCAFGCFYTVMFQPSSLIRGIAWGIFLELALVATSPRLLGLTIQGELFASSFVGHLAFGAALHLISRSAKRTSCY